MNWKFVVGMPSIVHEYWFNWALEFLGNGRNCFVDLFDGIP